MRAPTSFSVAQRHHKRCAVAILRAIDPQYVCGAGTFALHLYRAIKSGHGTGRRRRQHQAKRKTRNKSAKGYLWSLDHQGPHKGSAIIDRGHTTTFMLGNCSNSGRSTVSSWLHKATDTTERGLNRWINWAEKKACPMRYMPRRLAF